MAGLRFQTASEHCGSWPVLILMAKSEICTIDIRHEPENRISQRINSCETDFAISIACGDVWGRSFQKLNAVNIGRGSTPLT
jgi:hypothetical protein